MKPTSKQLTYLRALARRTRQTFAWPKTASDASAEITRLESIKKTPSAERRRERRQIQDDLAAGRRDAARFSADEVDGYGSRARWAGRQEQS